jgi:hypothetical protein
VGAPSLTAGPFIDDPMAAPKKFNKTLDMESEISRKLVEGLLENFLSGALGRELHERIVEMEKLPNRHRERLEALAEAVIWVAWVTDLGVVSATGRYDPEQSRRTDSHVLLIESWIPPDTHHTSWWRCDPQRPTEWTAGRGYTATSPTLNRES